MLGSVDVESDSMRDSLLYSDILRRGVREFKKLELRTISVIRGIE